MVLRNLAVVLLLAVCAPSWGADPSDDVFDLENLRVRITEEIPYLKVMHGGREVIVMRHQDLAHRIEAPFDMTSRDCPPFCLLPMSLHPHVETIGALEVVGYLRRKGLGDDSILLIDSRTPGYADLGTIPGAVNIAYPRLDPATADPADVADLLQLEFGAVFQQGLWNFAPAKTLVLFCNGPWCGQSPTNIIALLNLGYPPAKLKWYRGGMQTWEQYGLTTVKNAP